jgi:hypothetical protein
MEGSRREVSFVQLLVHGWFGEQPQRKAPGGGNRCAEAGGYEEMHPAWWGARRGQIRCFTLGGIPVPPMILNPAFRPCNECLV